METTNNAGNHFNFHFLQVLCGHDKPVTCVALSVDLDIAVSGSEDGTVNIYTVKEGYYMKTIIPPG